ncbi:MAG: Crp/Fnr family transcriptional regulator [Mesorhizobium sp.]|nr:MAG: Crp/Fnr family transcriptional regulator [Mesorhizobium sp.]
MVSASHPFLTGNENRPSSTRLDDDDKDYVKALGFALRQYPAETAIVDQGQHAARVFIIESGWGCISHNLAGGQRQILDFA